MKIILISGRHGGSRSLELGKWSRALLSLCCLGVPLGLMAWGYSAGQESEARSLRGAALDTLQGDLDQQSLELQKLQTRAEKRMQAMTLNLAELQARMTRLDALGEHLTAMADLAEGEFDFSTTPALGGPLASTENYTFSSTNVSGELEKFQTQLDDREQQFEILESLLYNRNLQEQRSLTGLPVSKGWVSSKYGMRSDPFTGKKGMHHGVDFAGRAGSDVLAVGAGIVSWTGSKGGYGQMVEISHGDGYVTRYAHNQKNLVEPGDVVRKGDTIALMGSSGRSTGAHVHYEVYKHGRSVDPSSYLARTRQR
jgi:murein DD-endopeptidase MepM/ murein hydrolase activator NlpD